MIINKENASSGENTDLVVLSVGLSLGIEDTCPVLSLEVGLVVNINLYVNSLSLGLDGVNRNTDGVENTSKNLSKSGWAPVDNLSSLQVELSSKNRVGDSSICYLTERKGLVDGRALVSKSINGSLGVNSNTDGKPTGNSRGGTSGCGKVIGGDAWHICKLGSNRLSVKGGGAL